MSDYLRELLGIFWLRPETALWRACDIQAMHSFEMRSPSLDLGCGDGLFSFVRAGGQFVERFDAFQSVGNLDKFFAKADVFDRYESSLGDVVKIKPRYQIDFGFDHKESLLKKSSDLGLYRNLRLGDANSRLPFEDAQFASIFSNIVYWLDDPRQTFSEISRVLKSGGQACVMLPNDTLPSFSFYQKFYKNTGDERFAFLDMLDRGRLSDNIKQSKSDSAWREIFDHAGLTVAHHMKLLSGPIIQIWDVGFRPMFPVFKKMTDLLSQSGLLEIKREWISTLEMFAGPLVKMDAEVEPSGVEPGFHCYILTK